MKLPATLLCDFYKLAHRPMYPTGTQKVYSTWTPRTSRIKNVDEMVHFGTSMVMQKLNNVFETNFFNRPKEDVVNEYARVVKHCLGDENPDVSHIEALHDLGYLPLKVKSLAEGTLVPLRVASVTVENTVDEFFWLTNYVETFFSAEGWQAPTSATLAREYRKILDKYALETNGSTAGVEFQGHDFSMRGMGGVESAMSSGLGHLLSFVGTDTIPSIIAAEHYYNADIEKELVGCSVPASEHSVQCAYGNDDEYIKRQATEVFPNGILSLVSDGRDLWHVLTDVLPSIKTEIMNRDGKLVIRPDSGNPVDIVCGTAQIYEVSDVDEIEDYASELCHDEASEFCGEHMTGDTLYNYYFKCSDKIYKATVEPFYNRHDKTYYYVDGMDNVTYQEHSLTPEEKGVIELLWETFGGTTNALGYKLLDDHIGCIYGDAITLERCEEICAKLKTKGFASLNMVYGIGSYTYQYNTRDTLGFAMKATLCVINGDEVQIFKDPVTDDGTKKSAKGAVIVYRDEDNGLLQMKDELFLDDTDNDYNLLQTVFLDGKLTQRQTFTEIREVLQNG